MMELKAAKGRLATLESRYLGLKNKPIQHLERICKCLDHFKRFTYTEKQLDALEKLINS